MKTFTNTQLNVDNLPQADTLSFNDLHSDYSQIVLISNALKYLVIVTAVILFFTLVPKVSLNWYILPPLILVPILLTWLAVTIAKTKQYALREHDLVFRHGLVWHKVTAVAFNRVQHIDLTSGPLERRYDIASLKFYTAGGYSADIKIPGLPKDDAQKLRAFILDKTGTLDENPEEDKDQNTLTPQDKDGRIEEGKDALDQDRGRDQDQDQDQDRDQDQNQDQDQDQDQESKSPQPQAGKVNE